MFKIKIDMDGELFYKEVADPAVVYDATNGKVLHIGEYDIMDKICEDRKVKCFAKGQYQASKDLSVMRLAHNQETIDRVWNTMKVEVLQ